MDTNEIKYKKISNPNGPLYTIENTDVLSITYTNGERETFTPQKSDRAQNSQSDRTNQPKFVERPVAANNRAVLESYKVPHDYYEGKKPADKPTTKGTAFFAFTDDSVLANEDLEISFSVTIQGPFRQLSDGVEWWLGAYPHHYEPFYIIGIFNKTDRYIYRFG